MTQIEDLLLSNQHTSDLVANGCRSHADVNGYFNEMVAKDCATERPVRKMKKMFKFEKASAEIK